MFERRRLLMTTGRRTSSARADGPDHERPVPQGAGPTRGRPDSGRPYRQGCRSAGPGHPEGRSPAEDGAGVEPVMAESRGSSDTRAASGRRRGRRRPLGREPYRTTGSRGIDGGAQRPSPAQCRTLGRPRGGSRPCGSAEGRGPVGLPPAALSLNHGLEVRPAAGRPERRSERRGVGSAGC